MNRLWSILFFLVPVGGIAACLAAANGWPPLAGAWLPENLSESGDAIDGLYILVHWICSVFFIGIGVAISVITWRFASVRQQRATYIHSNIRLEILWTVVPGLILIFIAIHQLNIWSAQKVDRPVDASGDPKPPMLHIVAKQFGWEFHYPGRDGKFETPDDFAVENLMVVPDDTVIIMQLRSRDVIHSFFVPKLRLKQDIVPGMTHIAWFKPKSAATMNILCAELCGWGHYRMTAILKVVSRSEFTA